MDARWGEVLATAAGVLLALLLVALPAALRRAWRALRAWRPARRPRPRAAMIAARLRGLRLARSRARARAAEARAAAATAEVQALRAALRLARAERDAALAGRAATTRPAPWRGAARDDRFARAKRAFALRFHPDRVPRDASDRPLRVAVFREYWLELRRIERDG